MQFLLYWTVQSSSLWYHLHLYVLLLAVKDKLYRYVYDTNPFHSRFKHSEISWGSCEIFSTATCAINDKDYLYSQGKVESASSLPKNVGFPVSLTHWIKHSEAAPELSDKNLWGETGKPFWFHGSFCFPVVSSARDLYDEFHDWNMCCGWGSSYRHEVRWAPPSLKIWAVKSCFVSQWNM